MNQSTMRVLFACALAGGFATSGCTDGGDGSSCTVTGNADETVTIACTDGTTATIPAPAAGIDGEPGTPGAPGAPGTGTPGSAGTPGTSCSVTQLASYAARIDCEDGSSSTICGQRPTDDYRNVCQTAEAQVAVAGGLEVEYLTRSIANSADQYAFWPHGATEAATTHIVFCIEGTREEIADGKLNPSVQTLDLATGAIHTVLRGMVGCDGIRSTPWGTILATEEFSGATGGLYEILLDTSDTDEYTITDRTAGTIEDQTGASGAAVVAKRSALPSMAWEGLAVLPSGVVIGGDELRPGSPAGADGGAIFKFIPTTLRTATSVIASLADSPLVAGSAYALQVSCVNNGALHGQGCEIGKGTWVSVTAATARTSAYAAGATGYYRPEDLELDPHFAGTGIRFCVASTGNEGASNYGEVLCAVDSDPNAAPTTQTVTINRFIEGDAELNQPDNFAFHPTIPGLAYVIEDNDYGDVWACLPDGADRDIKSDGCVRMLSVKDSSAEPTGFIFFPGGDRALLSIQHSADGNMLLVDDYATDDLIVVSGFTAPSAAAIAAFGTDTAADLDDAADELFGLGTPLASGVSATVARATTFPGGVAPTTLDNGSGDDAGALLALAGGLSAEFVTRVAAHDADQFDYWPHGSTDPAYAVFCIESEPTIIDDAGTLNPSVQFVDLATGDVRTILRGLDGCDGLRVSPWGTLLATEEFTDDGGVYEILWDPENADLDGVEITVDRTELGPEVLSVTAGALPGGVDIEDVVVRRTALPSMAWEGVGVLPSGVVIGGDELRPGEAGTDRDGGAIFKFVPATLRTSTDAIADLTESPLVAGSTYALQVSCVNSTQTYGQGCEIGNGRWIAIADPALARTQAHDAGATGYYRPEDLSIDPLYAGTGIRFCFCNTGNKSAQNYGEVMCATDDTPDSAPATRSVVINRFIEGDSELNQPDNIAFHPVTGVIYVIEDNGYGDIWACQPDGADRDVKSDGCVRMLSVRDSSAEPTGFEFHPSGEIAYFSIQHSADPDGALVDDYPTDDFVAITGFATASPFDFGMSVDERLESSVEDVFGFGTPLASSAVED